MSAFSFPDIPDDLWWKYQADQFKKAADDTTNGIFEGFKFRQAADEHIASIPQDIPMPSEMIAPPPPLANATPSPEAISPTPTPAPFDGSGGNAPITSGPNPFNPQGMSPDGTSQPTLNPFSPAPSFNPSPNVSSDTSGGSFLDHANAAISGIMDRGKEAGSSFLDHANQAIQGIAQPIGAAIGDAANTVNNELQNRGRIEQQNNQGFMDFGPKLLSTVDSIAGGEEARQDWEKLQATISQAVDMGYSNANDPRFAKDHPDLYKEAADASMKLVLGSMNPETPFAKGAGIIKPAVEEATQVAGNIVKSGEHPLQGFLDDLINRVESVPEDANGNIKYPTAAAQARKIIGEMKAKGLDTSDAEAAMEDFHMVARSDYERGADGAEEFHNNKRDAWDTFTQAIQEHDLGDTGNVGEAVTPIGPATYLIDRLRLHGAKLSPTDVSNITGIIENTGGLTAREQADIERQLFERYTQYRMGPNIEPGMVPAPVPPPEGAHPLEQMLENSSKAPTGPFLGSEIIPERNGIPAHTVAEEVDNPGKYENPPNTGKLYHVSSSNNLHNTGIDTSPDIYRDLRPNIWLSNDAPYTRGAGQHIYEINRDMLDPSKIADGPGGTNSYMEYGGHIPPEAVTHVGETTSNVVHRSPEPPRSLSMTREEIRQELDRTGNDPVSQDFFYTTVGEHYRGGDLSPVGENTQVWMTPDGPLGNRAGVQLAIDKSQLDPAKLSVAANGYPTYSGVIPESAIYNLGNAAHDNPPLLERLQAAARAKNMEPPIGGAPPSEPPTGGAPPSEPPTGGAPPSEPPTGGAPPSEPPTGGSLPTPGEGGNVGASVLRLAGDVVGAGIGGKQGFGDPNDTSVSPADRTIHTIAGALLGAAGAHALGGLPKILRGDGTTVVPGTAADIANAVANAGWKPYTKTELATETKAQAMIEQMHKYGEDSLPEGVKGYALNTEKQLSRQFAASGLNIFHDPALQQLIMDAAVKDNFYVGLRGGVQSVEVQRDLAAARYQTANDLIASFGKDRAVRDGDTQLIAGFINSQHRKVQALGDLLEQMKLRPDTDPTKESNILGTSGKIAREMDIIHGLVGVFAGSGSISSRSLGARRLLDGAIHTSDDAATLYLYKKFGAGTGSKADQAKAVQLATAAIEQLQALKANGGTATQFNNFWAGIEKGPVSGGDLFKLLRYNSMLSGPRTVEIALFSNGLQLLFKAPRDIISTGVAVAQGKATFRELQHEWAGAIAGYHMGTQAAMQVLMSGASDYSWSAEDKLTQSLAPRMQSGIGQGIVRAMEIPGRLTQMPDELARHIVMGMELHRQAGRVAHSILDQTTDKPLTGQAWQTKAQELVQNPTSQMLKNMQQAAELETFKGDMGSFGNLALKIADLPFNVGNIVLPFYRTSYHLTVRGIDASPLGLGATLWDVGRGSYGPIGDILTGQMKNPEGITKNLNPNLGRRLFDGVAGTTTMLWLYSQSLQGNISGSGPADPQQKSMLLAKGWQPYSFKVDWLPWNNKKPIWISYANMGPVAIPMALTAASAESQTYHRPQDGNDFLSYLSDTGKRALAVGGEQTYLQSLKPIFDMLSGNTPGQAVSRFTSNFLSSLVPYGAAINTVGQATDPVQRRADPGDIVGGVTGRFPGVNIAGKELGRTTLAPAQDTLGRPITNSLQGVSALNPIRVADTSGKESPALDMMSRYGVDYPGIPSTWGTHQLNPSQQRQLQGMMGRNADMAMQRLQQSGVWNAARSDAERKLLIQSVLNKARDEAGKNFLGLLPIQQANPQALTPQDVRQTYSQGRSVLDTLPYMAGGR